jgi:hypothetical protein
MAMPGEAVRARGELDERERLQAHLRDATT